MKNFAMLALALAMTVGGAAMAETAARQITVTGEAQVHAEPDMATITLGVVHTAEEASEAMGVVSEGVGRILKRLADEGIAPRDLQTRNLSLNPEWASDRKSYPEGTQRITGFTARNTVFVRVRELSELGRIMDLVIADGANNFNGLEFSLQNPDPLMDQARQRAVEDGIARAKLLAEAAGVTLGPVQSISDHSGTPRPMMMEYAGARSADMAIAAGEVALQANVTLIFSIAD